MLKELEGIRGRHTELVSVYVPAGGNLLDTIAQLKNEQSTASNIKSKATRKNVVDALEKIIQHLRTFKKTPENGLVVFGGNISEVEGRPDVKVWSFEPPEKMNTKLYWCDQVFVLEPIEEMVKEKEIYGLIVLDSKEANIGILKGKKVVPLRNLESAVPGKTTKGGFSQMRYQHVREALLNDFLKEIGGEASKILLEQKNLKGIVIGGPGPTKDNFVKDEYLHHELRPKIIGVKDISYTGEYGLEELANRSQDLLKDAAVAKEKEILEKFFTELQKDGKVVYGVDKTIKMIEAGQAETVLISESFDWLHLKLKCQSGHTMELRVPKVDSQNLICDVCQAKTTVEQSLELSEEIAEKAAQFGTEVVIVSTDTREGWQFKELGGVGALLRFKI